MYESGQNYITGPDIFLSNQSVCNAPYDPVNAESFQSSTVFPPAVDTLNLAPNPD